ncbi:MAG: hypothetical protein ABIJ15_01595 [bacterium]
MLKKISVVIVAIAAAIVFAAAPAVAETRPVQLALIDPVQIFNADTSISGVRLNLLYGRNDSVTGLDLGLVGVADSDFTGWQYNFVGNITKGNFSGLQMGFVNYANSAKGLQLGVVNYAVSLKGLQIGVINIIVQGGMFPVFPFVNWAF